MGRPLRRLLASASFLILLASPASAQHAGSGAGNGNVLLDGAAIPYQEIAPGVRQAILYGSPSAEGQPFTFRLHIAESFEMGPHTHPVPEHMTVLSGRFFVGIGAVVDSAKAVEYGPGSYIVVDAGVPAYMWAEGETVVQVHGVGPLRTVMLDGQ